jgi:stage II sporulation protein M
LLSKIREMIVKHIKNNFNTYFFLLLAFVIGISAGAFTVNGLSAIQREELMNYFQGFIHLLDNQKVDTNELLRISIYEYIRIIAVLWVLGLTIIGIPFIFILLGIRGFITGFCSGFIIQTLGLKGAMFTLFALLPKEFIIIPCLIALGVNGINFSLNIMKNKSIKRISKESWKTRFAGYCVLTMFYTCLVFIGILLEVYVTPVLIRMLSPIIT